MTIQHDLNLIASPHTTIREALEKLDANKRRILFVLDEHGRLIASVSDGDIRRGFLNKKDLNFSCNIIDVANKDVRFHRSQSPKAELERLFRDGVEAVPIVDQARHFLRVATREDLGFSVANVPVDRESPSYIIAEIGNNHQGSIKHAKLLIDYSRDAGANCVKFQMRSMSQLYKNSGAANDPSADLAAQYTLGLLEKYQLSKSDLFEAFDYAKRQGITPLCTPWDAESLNQLELYGMDAYKIASADLTNHDLLRVVAATGKPMFCSTGMSTEEEILASVTLLNELGANYILLHCNSTYPTPYKDVNLQYMTRLQRISTRIVGYSGHERGIHVPIAAVSLGAKVIEKHITTDQELEGSDHKVSLLPGEFKSMVQCIRQVEDSLGGEGRAREVTQGELINRENLAKSIVAKQNILRGTLITRDMLEVKSPGQGLQPNKIDNLVGRLANRDIEGGDFFYETDIKGQIEKRNFNFSRPYGVPVRYHDFEKIVNGIDLNFVEFHLSYGDLKLDPSSFLKNIPAGLGFAVHSPELFEEDHVLDLAAEDEKYRSQSKAHLCRVIALTRQLKQWFPTEAKPVIVINAGGWSRDGFLNESKKEVLYERISDALHQLDHEGVSIAIQTMPPFPWHFGGQAFHNLFVSCEEIVKFCESNPAITICLDVSHTMMACNYYGWDFARSVQKIAPFVRHMHIVDAKGSDGEGVKIGSGDVDFAELGRILKKHAPRIQFIPEIWQGHKNGGEGFWEALAYLEDVL